ncbi:MAG: hypothetical protein JWP71_527 [Mucilaginibacter sp.]|nr:hypothetical protein [Mucilaginibacter sp.]
MLRISILILLLSGIVMFGRAQDTLTQPPVKKQIAKPAAAKPGGAIPINPKTGRPYTKYGYGSYAKAYRAAQIADSLKKASPIKIPSTTIATTPPDAARVDTTVKIAPAPIDKSLNGQYQYLLTKVYRAQQPFVEAMWKTFMDTLKTTRNQLKDVHEKLNQQSKIISGLQTDVSNRDQTLLQTDTISLFGISLSKTSYNLIMWGLVVAIGIIAAVVIAQSGGYRKEATYRTTLYNELEEEFKAYKAKTNEKEKKLARELQTERNKVDELMGRG